MNTIVAPRTSTTAIVSLVFGIVTWFALPLIGAIIAVICGHAARGEIRRSTGQLEGGGMALTGLLLGWIHLLLLGALALFVLALPLSIFGLLHGFWSVLHALPGCDTTA